MGTRIKTNKGGRKGCRNKALSVAALFAVLGLVLMGASECNVGGKPRNQSCAITARDTLKIYMDCKDNGGRGWKEDVRAPSDLYPNCQVGTYWPGCKGK